MTSDPKGESPDNPDQKRPGDNVEDEKNRNVWDGTIRTLKLSIMKTGIFGGAQVQKALQKQRDEGRGDASGDSSEELDLSASEIGSDPYDSSYKK